VSELTDAQIETFRESLLALKGELETLLNSTADEVKPVQLDQPIGRLSRIDAIQMQKMAQAHRRRNETRLAQVRAALMAMERDEYGLCKRCEEPVSRTRLDARPETPLCLACQEELEG